MNFYSCLDKLVMSYTFFVFCSLSRSSSEIFEENNKKYKILTAIAPRSPIPILSQDFHRHFMFCLKIVSIPVMYCNSADSHCAFSSNLFHGYLAQILINQLSDPENKKCSPWKVFGKNHPQILLLLSRRGPRSPEARLSQHYIGPKMTFQHFSNFCRKKFPGLTKRLLYNSIQF